jgi:copper transport protein
MPINTTRFLLIRKEAPFRLNVNVRFKVAEVLERGQWVRLSVLMGLCVLAALAAAPAASAHARLLATEPSQGAVLDRAPARVTFTFDEGVRSAGQATLTGGKLAKGISAPQRLRDGGKVLDVDLPAVLADGDYVVTWRVVSDDGHLETGALAFGVGAGTPAPSAVVGQKTQRDNLLTFARWVFLVGLLAAAGLAAARLVLGRREPQLAAAALASALLLAAAGALLELSRIPTALGTRFGIVMTAAVGVALVAAAVAAAAVRVPAALRFAEAAAMGLVVAPPLAGHALASDRPVALAFPADLIHTSAAAVWIGGVLWLGLLAGRDRDLRATGRRFARLALVAVAVLGASGVARAGAELTSIDQVTSTSYGQLLLVKTVLFGVLLGAGALSARFADRGALSRFRRSVGAEALLLAGLLAAVAGLGSVTPPRNLGVEAPPELPAPAIVFGRQVDELAVGIAAAVRDGKLGVRTTVLAETGLPANGLDVEVAPGRQPWSSAEACGDGVYCAQARVSTPAPRVRLRISRSGKPSRTVSVTLPAEPQHALAKRIVRAAEAATRELRTVVIHEQLSADPTLVLDTTFTIARPDRMTYISSQRRNGTTKPGGQAVVIGGTRWDRSGPNQPWSRSSLQPLDQPVPDWRQAVDASLLGRGTLDGRPVWRVGFRDPTVPAWFEVAIDRRTSRPLQVHMIAAAHFMVRDWGAFDDPVSIRPPTR